MATLPQIRTPHGQRAAPRFARSRHIPGTLLAGIALLVVAGVGLLQVLQTSRTATAGYELRSLENERQTLSAEVRLLEAEIAQQTRVEQIRRTAIDRLGMVPPQRTIHIAVGVTAPSSARLPERYVVQPQRIEMPPLSVWERLLRRLPGFN